MKTVTRTTAAVATLVLAGTGTFLGVGLTSNTAQAHSSPRTVLSFVAHDDAGNMAFEDLGAPSPNGPDLGDVVAFTQGLTSNGKAVGRISNAAIGVDHKRHLFQASGTIVLATGQINVAGLVSMGHQFRLAVIGGQGHYTGANGWMDITNVHGQQQLKVTLVH
jgi:hypothetical protein